MAIAVRNFFPLFRRIIEDSNGNNQILDDLELGHVIEYFGQINMETIQ